MNLLLSLQHVKIIIIRIRLIYFFSIAVPKSELQISIVLSLKGNDLNHKQIEFKILLFKTKLFLISIVSKRDKIAENERQFSDILFILS